MITVKVICDSGRNWVTAFNGSFPAAKDYFVCKTFTDEDDAGNETHHTCVRIELLT